MKNKFTKRFSLISLLAIILGTSSCTYDYFEDESNYVVYVPKADKDKRTDTYKVDDVKILIYNENDLERERYSTSPFEESSRSKAGNFNFKIYPGIHHVYCFSNIAGIDFLDQNSYNAANFRLKQINDEGQYEAPQGLLLDRKKPNIIFPGPVVTDTAWFERRYAGRICVLLKNMPELATAKTVKINASNIGTVQYLSKITDSLNTRSARNSTDDYMLQNATLYADPVPGKGFDYGFSNYYFPSLDAEAEGLTGEIAIKLSVEFYDANNNKINYNFNSFLIDKITRNPLVLHMNHTLYVLIDGNDLTVIDLGNLIDWNPDIQGGGPTHPGDPGMGV